MTRGDYQDKVRQHAKRTRIPGFLVLASWLAVAIVGSSLFREHQLVFLTTFLTYFAVSCVGLRSWARRSIDELSLDCPDCGTSLIGREGRPSEVIVATGRCGACGARVLEDGDE